MKSDLWRLSFCRCAYHIISTSTIKRNYDLQHELGRLVSLQIQGYQDLMGKNLEDELMDNYWAFKICLWNKDES
jgi:hypothetical protein